ncbi:MAG: cob(I)yrinic acid a,c-diamide adenosyltransferase [Clostridia bacterium]|jgi:cob(I)alamin adenosyltransferase|nr:cob(I)yrinic acid a,c-diamide adenosyltransferase [Clostridia bacterium]MDD4571533.1 cob(I)yrinic acid a,c-diamide adenosyltransferase [Clostridia bacterium]
MAERERLTQGLVQIYTGNGKGKSTAAFGLALRAAGRNMKVVIIQFMKAGGGYGEEDAFKRLAPNVELYSYGSGKWVKKGLASEEDKQIAAKAMAHAETALMASENDIVVLDEINNALYFELVTLDEVKALLAKKLEHIEVVLTGRNAPQALIELADLVTEMREIKHPFHKGINSRAGIEY